jgi:hypothetical protein
MGIRVMAWGDGPPSLPPRSAPPELKAQRVAGCACTCVAWGRGRATAAPRLSGVSRLCCAGSVCTGLSVHACTLVYMRGVRWQLRLDRELADRVDAACGVLGQSRSEFVRRALGVAAPCLDPVEEARIDEVVEEWRALGEEPGGESSARVSSVAKDDPSRVEARKRPASPRAPVRSSPASVGSSGGKPPGARPAPRAAPFNVGPKPFTKPRPKP